MTTPYLSYGIVNGRTHTDPEIALREERRARRAARRVTR